MSGQQYKLVPQVVEILDRAARIRGRQPGIIFAAFERDELVGLAAAALVEVLRRDELDAVHPFLWATPRQGGDDGAV